MQSSPPARAGERPMSPADSQYSLDLGALDLDTLSDLGIPQQKVERIFSEDIDGPSDFTQNMEAWMRGGSLPKGSLGGKKLSATQTIPEDDERDARDSEEDNKEDEFDGVSEDEDLEEHHAPGIGSDAASNPAHDHDPAEDMFSSEWHTYDSASTPLPPVHKQFLQPTVEDYYSELSPARQLSAQKARGRAVDSPNAGKKEAHAQGRNQTPERAAGTSLSPERSPKLQRTSTNEEAEYHQEKRMEMDNQLQRLESKCQQLQHLNEALGQALEEDRRMRQEQQEAHDSKMAEAARRERDLKEMKEAAYQHNDKFRREFGELKERLRDQEKQAEPMKPESDISESGYKAELLRVKEQMEAQKLEHSEQIASLQRELAFARRSRDEAEENSKIDRQELDDVHRERERLRAQVQQTHLDEATIAQLELRLEEANAEIKRLKTTNRDAQNSVDTLQDQLQRAKQADNGETARISSERVRAVELATNLQRQLQDLRQQLKEEQASHEAEIKGLKSRHDLATQTSNKELEVVRTELNAKQSELNEAILERDEAQDTLQSHHSEEEALRAKLAEQKAITEELDARISDKLQRREKYWKDKLAESDKERQLMAKTLLHQWGRDEVGIDSPQMYAYKYVKRESPGKSPRSPTKSKVST